jgi:hypothetical protein
MGDFTGYFWLFRSKSMHPESEIIREDEIFISMSITMQWDFKITNVALANKFFADVVVAHILK